MTLLTPTEIRDLRKKLGISQTKLAAALGCHKNTMDRFEKGTQQSLRIQLDATRLLRELQGGKK